SDGSGLGWGSASDSSASTSVNRWTKGSGSITGSGSATVSTNSATGEKNWSGSFALTRFTAGAGSGSSPVSGNSTRSGRGKSAWCEPAMNGSGLSWGWGSDSSASTSATRWIKSSGSIRGSGSATVSTELATTEENCSGSIASSTC